MYVLSYKRERFYYNRSHGLCRNPVYFQVISCNLLVFIFKKVSKRNNVSGWWLKIADLNLVINDMAIFPIYFLIATKGQLISEE